MRHNKLSPITQKQKNALRALREIELIHREFREDVSNYKKGEYITTIKDLISDYIDEIVIVAKQLKFNDDK